MSIPAEKKEEIQAWLKKASDDLRAAELDLSANPPLTEDAHKFLGTAQTIYQLINSLVS